MKPQVNLSCKLSIRELALETDRRDVINKAGFTKEISYVSPHDTKGGRVLTKRVPQPKARTV